MRQGEKGEVRQGKVRQGEVRQGEVRQGEVRQGKARRKGEVRQSIGMGRLGKYEENVMTSFKLNLLLMIFGYTLLITILN